MDVRVEGTYQARVLWEKSLAVGGGSYLVICGEHINGGFIAIPNWGICIEAGGPSDIYLNAENFQRVGLSENQAMALAQAIAAADTPGKAAAAPVLEDEDDYEMEM